MTELSQSASPRCVSPAPCRWPACRPCQWAEPSSDSDQRVKVPERRAWICMCGTLQHAESDVCDTCADTYPGEAEVVDLNRRAHGVLRETGAADD